MSSWLTPASACRAGVMPKLALKRRLSDWLTGHRAEKFSFETTEYPGEAVLTAIRNGLGCAAAATPAETRDRLTVAVVARDDVDRVRAGVVAFVENGWLTTELHWVDEPLRGRGIGTRLLAMIERFALSRGVYRFRLDTSERPALLFYQYNGYDVYAELPDHPPGQTRYSMSKVIDLTGGA
ncbi:MAG: GNAT family N-acetyltransferase [Pseudomonadota bacterium]